jgi:hypothetical protein
VVGAHRGVLAHADTLFCPVRMDFHRGAARLRTTSGCMTTSPISTASTTHASPNLPLHRVTGRYKIHDPRLAQREDIYSSLVIIALVDLDEFMTTGGLLCNTDRCTYIYKGSLL